MPQKKRYIKKKINRNAYFAFYLYMIIALLAVFTMSSYTWFSLSRTPRVNNMNVYITTGSGLELSKTPDENDWVQELLFLDLIPKMIDYNEGKFKVNAKLRPATWSDQDGCFYEAKYGVDGRHYEYEELNDGENECYIKVKYYARSGQPIDVQLQQVKSLNLKGENLSITSMSDMNLSGSFVMAVPGFSMDQIIEAYTNAKIGQADKSIRIGFRITMVDSKGNKLGDPQPMIIYEPNCDVHVDDDLKGYVDTPSIDGTATLVGSEEEAQKRLLRQGATRLGNINMSTKEAEIVVGEFDKELNLFHLDPGDIALVEMFIWLEGQDVDCTNASAFTVDYANKENKGYVTLEQLQELQWLFGNIQFTGTTEGQSALVPIPIDEE